MQNVGLGRLGDEGEQLADLVTDGPVVLHCATQQAADEETLSLPAAEKGGTT
ncbi:hypothetical protein [Streptomyces sp. MA15]|uniref:hypothetical protein n=1 Tax=Streptomyces sp. MA15 TaxID=3055061 RepID=UPI0025B0C796|nr:hypothetical protein [Streptomyces sp. MA15]MDN3270163.1 hypothetical protein [Streptomyces sp. MA15]